MCDGLGVARSWRPWQHGKPEAGSVAAASVAAASVAGSRQAVVGVRSAGANLSINKIEMISVNNN